MAKKCIKHEMTGKIRRVNEHEASKLTAHHRVIEESGWNYIPKHVWKAEIRDKKED